MNGKIYKIIHTQSDIVYIGSTMNELRVRFNQHKTNNYNKCAIRDLITQYGQEQFKIILIKEYKVIDKKHLLAYEQLWINKLKCINTNNTLFIKKISKRNYYNKNKEQILKYQKEYAIKNKEYISNYNAKYHEINDIKRKEKIYCEVCKYEFVKRELNRHNQSSRHQSNLIEYKEPKYKEKKHLCKICNIYVTRLNKHEKTKKHLDAINS